MKKEEVEVGPFSMIDGYLPILPEVSINENPDETGAIIEKPDHDFVQIQRKSKARPRFASKGPYQCDKCGKRRSSVKLLESHLLYYHDDAYTTCQICKTVFRHNRTLISHIKRKHSKYFAGFPGTCIKKEHAALVTVVKDEHTIPEAAPERSNRCVSSNKFFINHDSPGRHDLKSKETDGTNERLRCTHCGNKFTTQDGLTTHIIHFHQRLFECDLCEIKERSKFMMENHMKAVHLKMLMLTCWFCKPNKVFKRIRELREHSETKHSDERNYICQHCGKAYKTDKALRNHLKSGHGKLEQCQKCGKMVGHMSAHLNAHRRWEREKLKEVPLHSLWKTDKTIKYENSRQIRSPEGDLCETVAMPPMPDGV